MEILHTIFWLTCTMVMIYNSVIGLWKYDTNPASAGTIMTSGQIQMSPPESGNATSEQDQIYLRWDIYNWDNCESSPVKIRNLSFVHGTRNESANLNVTWEVDNWFNLSTPVKLDVSVSSRLVGLAWLPLPCNDTDFDLCNQNDLCFFLSKPCPAPWGLHSHILQPGEQVTVLPVGSTTFPSSSFWRSRRNSNAQIKIQGKVPSGERLFCLRMVLRFT